MSEGHWPLTPDSEWTESAVVPGLKCGDLRDAPESAALERSAQHTVSGRRAGSPCGSWSSASVSLTSQLS